VRNAASLGERPRQRACLPIEARSNGRLARALSSSGILHNDSQHRKAERDCGGDMQNVAQIFIPEKAHE
jgi:hypothetical protein